MKFTSPVLLLLALSCVHCVGASKFSLSPITRVVELLQQLSSKIEADGKTEQDLYEKFVCWGQSVISTKTASNAAANSRIQELETYIADLDAGRIELTSERSDLEKEIEGLNADLEAAAEMRENEHNEFLEAEDEMNKGITALNKAIDVLKEATEGHEQGVLLSLDSHFKESFSQRTADAAALSKAVQLGDKFLTKGDALFLRRLLTGEVPTPDWKKLNRKANFKMSYKARSSKIQEVLAKLLSTFETNLTEAQAKETQAQNEFQTLTDAKNQQLQQARAALEAMEKENGAKGMSKADAQAELDDLRTQVSNDEGFITDVQQTLATKKGEYKTRVELRSGELEAISKAIAILRNDDNRDLFKRSFASQAGESFLQEGSSTSVQSAQQRAADALRQAARKSKDTRLLNLAKSLSALRLPTVSLASSMSASFAPAPAPLPSSLFQPVIEAIDNMVAILKSEMDEDLTNKETCEADRATDARNAVLASRAIDEMSDTITRLKSEIEVSQQEKADKEALLAQITADIQKAGEIREEENKEWTKNDADDQEAAQVVASATSVLQQFYSESGLMLAQQPQAPAGRAPLPPPATWEGPYGGKTQEAQGILEILTMIKEDIDKDRAKAKTAEDEAAAAYTTAYEEFVTQSNELNQAISTLEGTIGSKEGEVVTTKESRATKKGELDVHMKKMKDAEPGCNFVTVNYEVRRSNRQIEIDGLLKAKAILQGAVFEIPEDENRELKPGDALLQRARKHF